MHNVQEVHPGDETETSQHEFDPTDSTHRHDDLSDAESISSNGSHRSMYIWKIQKAEMSSKKPISHHSVPIYDRYVDYTMTLCRLRCLSGHPPDCT
jgi:hypothetical protein